jgi:tryptophan synthase alpha chain
MSRIADVFKSGRKALIPYVTVGYPSVEATLKIVPMLARNGADIIELGVPFSDPLADGVTIQHASFEALRNGVTTETCLDIAGKLRKQIETPLVFMSYFNPIYKYGTDRFCSDCATAGVDGLIIPDLPPEEGGKLELPASNNGVDIIYLLAPTSTPTRVKQVAQHSRGFIYLVSVAGVTGARTALPETLTKFVSGVRRVTKKPLCVGFGISTAEQASRVAKIADGVIVGSKIIQLMELDKSLNQAEDFVREIREAIDSRI